MTSIYFERSFQRSFGTFSLKGYAVADAMCCEAANLGYRAFETAQMYGNEADVGTVLFDIGLPRDALCITTMVDPNNFAWERFLPSVEASLKALRLDVVNVLLLHWPPVGGDIAKPLALLSEAKRRGLARYIGISNFTAAMMREAGHHLDGALAASQVKFHPLLNQSVLLAAAIET